MLIRTHLQGPFGDAQPRGGELEVGGSLYGPAAQAAIDRAVTIGAQGLYAYQLAIDGTVHDFSSCDYHMLAQHPSVVEAACQAAHAQGTGTGGARILGGGRQAHRDLERDLAAFVLMPAAFTTSSGAAANDLALSALAGPGDLVIADRHAHDSLRRAARNSGADVVCVPHNDVNAVAMAAVGSHALRVLLVVDGVFSMHGDLPPLQAYAELKRQRPGLIVLVDDAHATGTIGPGGRGSRSLPGGECIDVITGSLSKALGSSGGFIAGPHALISLLPHLGSGPFSSALAPPCAAAARAALQLIGAQPVRVERLGDAAARLRRRLREAGFATGGDDRAPMVPVHFDGEGPCLRAARHLLLRHRIYAAPVLYPAVPCGTALLRVAASSARAETEEDRLIRGLIEARQEGRRSGP